MKGFDNEKYIRLQSQNIAKRVQEFGGKLYLEFGGKLFDDYHASRVLPGFKPDTKVEMLSKIKDEVDNPLVISGGISDVNSDLVIDLNGHEIQRNNREPLLNVTQGVKLTIIDTSEEQTGSFYNPVGSVLRISGGSLTVSAGEFESGPRSGEERAHPGEYCHVRHRPSALFPGCRRGEQRRRFAGGP